MIKLPNFAEEQRPWGSFKRFTKNEESTVKIIEVRPHEAFSLQKHAKRREFWFVLNGGGFITNGTERMEARPNDTFIVETDTLHRAEAGDNGLSLLEISFGEFDEEDITRVEDKYGRV